MPERKTLNEDLFYKGSSANLPRLHTCENKVNFASHLVSHPTSGIGFGKITRMNSNYRDGLMDKIKYVCDDISKNYQEFPSTSLTPESET